MAETSPIVQADGLTKNFGKLTAVRDLSLAIRAGEVFGFLGPNGAGKTTTIRMLIGLVRPTSGSASVARFDVLREAREVKRRVGYVAETPYLYPKLTGREFLEFMAGLYGVASGLTGHRATRLLG